MIRNLIQGMIKGLLLVAIATVTITINFSGSTSLHTVRAADCDPAKETCKFTPLPQPELNGYKEADVLKVDLDALPLIPEITNTVKIIYQEGVSKGNNIRTFSKIGDCMTATNDFMVPFAKVGYTLGDYATLENVIKVYTGVPADGKDGSPDSLANLGLAATSGFNAASVQDPLWADPKYCSADESPLACEYRTVKPAISIIMFGTNDMKSIKPDQFDYYLRKVVVDTANLGIIPVMSTFPVQPGLEKESVLFNQITAKVAADYDFPLINLYKALQPLDHQGVDPDHTTHMTKASETANTGDLSADGLKYGYNTRNLLVLQTLEAVLKAVQPDALK